MKKLLIIITALIAVVFVACSDESINEPFDNLTSKIELKSIQVSVFDTTSLTNPLEVLLVGEKVQQLSKSRSGSFEVKDIQTIYDDNNNTLIFIVNYTNNGGYVVLSALKDHAPILACSDEGYLDSKKLSETGLSLWFSSIKEEVMASATLPDSVKFQNHLEWAQLINETKSIHQTSSRANSEWDSQAFDEMNEWLKNGYQIYPLSDFFPQTNFTPVLPEGMLPPEYLVYSESYVTGRQVIDDSYVIIKEDYTQVQKILLSTNWGQFWPYNQSIPDYPNNLLRALGCSTVALGQIIANKKYDIGDFNYTEMLKSNPNNLEISRFLYYIGSIIGIDYSTDDPGAYVTQVRAAVTKLGLTYDSNTHFDSNIILNSLYNSIPVYVRGTDPYEEQAHAWVCDGYKKTTNSRDIKIKLAPQFDDVTMTPFWTYSESQYFSDPTNYLHYNWGDYGNENGFFLSNNFKFGKLNYQKDVQIISNIKKK